MTLTDVGVGPTTIGTARRSPGIYIPITAHQTNESFWEWPYPFVGELYIGFSRRVRLSLGGRIISVTINRIGLRLRGEALRRAGNGDILYMEKGGPERGSDYSVEVIRQGTASYDAALARCSQPIRNSKKRFGYY